MLKLICTFLHLLQHHETIVIAIKPTKITISIVTFFFFSFHFLALLFQPIKNAFRLAKFNLDGFCKKHLEVSKEKHFPRVKTNLKKILFNLQQRCRICWKIESSGVKIVSVCCLSNCKKELSIIFIRNARRITSKRRVARWVTINGRKCGSHTLRVIRICSARLTM